MTREDDNQNKQSYALPRQLKNCNIPKAFIQEESSKLFLCNLIENFNFEEKQAIYYCTVVDNASIDEIAKKIELTPEHVIGVLLIYSERLKYKLNFFKKIMPYDENDTIPLEEMLFIEASRAEFVHSL
ncbi:MAG: hypothetical protein FWD05_03340 [Oscillospiraceae bacterium]|nr:hypothetical protein [Oscillospiraceae bacterium]